MHPRITLNQISLADSRASNAGDDTLTRDIELCENAGVSRIGIRAAKLEAKGWEPGIEQLRSSSLEVTHLVHRAMYELDNPDAWPAADGRGRCVAQAAAALGAPLIYITTGPPGSLLFEDAADAFVQAVAPTVDACARLGIAVSVETTNAQYHDLHLLHTLRDTIDVAGRAGLKVCVDLHACWTEPGLRDRLRQAADSIALVQLGDYAPGQHCLDRTIPGDGIIPMEKIIGWLLEDGYGGLFDLEFPGHQDLPRIDAVRRAVDNVTAMLERLGI